MGPVLFDRADGLDEDDLFFIGQGGDVGPGEVGEEAVGGNEAVHHGRWWAMGEEIRKILG